MIDKMQAAIEQARMMEYQQCNTCRALKMLVQFDLMEELEEPVTLDNLDEVHEYICRQCKKERTNG